jgi:hypothetical protein
MPIEGIWGCPILRYRGSDGPALVGCPRIDRTGPTRIRPTFGGLVRFDGPGGDRMGDPLQRPQAGSSDGLVADTEGRIYTTATSSAARLIQLPPR